MKEIIEKTLSEKPPKHIVYFIGIWYFDSSCYFQSFHIVQFEYWHERLSIDTIRVDSVAQTYCSFLLRILLKQNTALLSTVRPCVTGVTSHISHIYKGITAMLIIRGPIKPYIF